MQGGGNLSSLIISFINSQKSKSKLMEFTKTDNLSGILFEAIDVIMHMGYCLPSISHLDSLFTALRTVNVRDVLNEILTSGDIKITYPMYKIRLESLITYDRNLKNDSISFEGHTFIFTNACNSRKQSAIRHYGTDEAAKEYFSSVYTLTNMVQIIVNDLKTALNYIEEQVIKTSNNNSINNAGKLCQNNKIGASYEIKTENKEAVLYIYNSLKGDAFELTETQFCTLVENADFSSVYGKKQKNKAKIKYMISCLSVCMGSVWYGNAAKSIGVKPQECSGANVSEYIRNKLNKDKIEEIIKRKQ